MGGTSPLRCLLAVVFAIATAHTARAELYEGQLMVDGLGGASSFLNQPVLLEPLGRFMFHTQPTLTAHAAAVRALTILNGSSALVGAQEGFTPFESAVLDLQSTVLAITFTPLIVGSSAAVAFAGDVPMNVSIFSEHDGVKEAFESRSVREDMTSAECAELVKSARATTSFTLGEEKTQHIQVVLESEWPNRWYVMLSHCGARSHYSSKALDGLTSASVGYRLLFANQGGYFSQQFSVESQGFLEASLLLLTVACVAVLCTCCVSLFNRCWIEQKDGKSKRHDSRDAYEVVVGLVSAEETWRRALTTYWVAAGVVLLNVVTLACDVAYGVRIAQYGEVATSLFNTSSVFDSMHMLLLVSTLLLISTGWATSSTHIHSLCWMISLWFIVSLIGSIVLLIWQDITGDFTSRYLLYQSNIGISVLCLMSLALATFFGTGCSRYRRLQASAAKLVKEFEGARQRQKDRRAEAGHESDSFSDEEDRLIMRIVDVADNIRKSSSMVSFIMNSVACWCLSNGLVLIASIFLYPWLRLRIVGLTARVTTLLLELGTLYALQPRGFRDPELEKRDSKRRKREKPTTCCGRWCENCRKRAKATRKRAAMLKHVGGARRSSEQSVEEISDHERQRFSAPSEQSLPRLELSMNTIGSSRLMTEGLNSSMLSEDEDLRRRDGRRGGTAGHRVAGSMPAVKEKRRSDGSRAGKKRASEGGRSKRGSEGGRYSDSDRDQSTVAARSARSSLSNGGVMDDVMDSVMHVDEEDMFYQDRPATAVAAAATARVGDDDDEDMFYDSSAAPRSRLPFQVNSSLQLNDSMDSPALAAVPAAGAAHARSDTATIDALRRKYRDVEGKHMTPKGDAVTRAALQATDSFMGLKTDF